MSSSSPSLCEACGWASAALAALAFGTFGVPIKSRAVRSVRIDPLVFQSYKTATCLVTCFPILLLVGWYDDGSVPATLEAGAAAGASSSLFAFTPWGIVSGLFWVPGGVATVYAVQSAGLAMGVGIGSSFICLVSFVWGIFVFGEPVHSRSGATFAVSCMVAGLMGMSYFSAPQQQQPLAASTSTLSLECDDDGECEDDDVDNNNCSGQRYARKAQVPGSRRLTLSAPPAYSELDVRSDDGRDEPDEGDALQLAHDEPSTPGAPSGDERTSMGRRSEAREASFGRASSYGSDDADGAVRASSGTSDSADEDASAAGTRFVAVGCGGLRFKLSRRHAGMLSAAFCGIWGGSITAPMRYAPPEARGARYLFSFAVGASIINLALWLLRLLAVAVSHYKRARVDRRYLHVSQSDGSSPDVVSILASAYRELPSFHFRVMWRPGGLSGLLWSIGNFFSLLSVFYLGEGVGYPLVQTSILVSGLWGLLYYREVTGTERRAKWFASSLLTVFGILLLSYEHHEK